MPPTARAAATKFETPTDLELVMSRIFEAPRSLVFEAFTQPEHLPHWLIGPSGWTMTECEIDLRPGGAWRFAWSHADGETMELSGEYLEVEPPARIVQTESWGEDWPETVNTLELEEDGGRTTMRQRIRFPSREARDAARHSGMEEGSSRSFELLGRHLEAIAS